MIFIRNQIAADPPLESETIRLRWILYMILNNCLASIREKQKWQFFLKPFFFFVNRKSTESLNSPEKFLLHILITGINYQELIALFKNGYIVFLQKSEIKVGQVSLLLPWCSEHERMAPSSGCIT